MWRDDRGPRAASSHCNQLDTVCEKDAGDLVYCCAGIQPCGVLFAELDHIHMARDELDAGPRTSGRPDETGPDVRIERAQDRPLMKQQLVDKLAPRFEKCSQRSDMESV